MKLTILGAICTTLLATSATSQQEPMGNHFRVCGPMEPLMSGLVKGYGESIQMVLNNDMSPNEGGQTILTANIETGTWSLIVIGPDYPDLVCIIQSGQGFSHDLIQEIEPMREFDEDA